MYYETNQNKIKYNKIKFKLSIEVFVRNNFFNWYLSHYSENTYIRVRLTNPKVINLEVMCLKRQV